MSRRDDLVRAQAAIFKAQQAPKAQQKRPETMCGLCRHYSETAFSGHGTGTCDVLKMGSDIQADPPVFVTEGANGYQTMNLADAAKCRHYEKMDFVDTDGTECSDPKHRRSMRQMQNM